MQRKLLATCLSLAAFAAFAVLPALASAKHLEFLTAPGTATLKNGDLVKGKSSKLVFKGETGGGLISCEAEITGKVVANSATTGSKVTIEKASFWKIGGKAGEDCATNFGGTVAITPERLPWCLKSISNEDRLTLDAGDCSVSEPLRVTLQYNFLGEQGKCIYEAEHAVSSVNLNTTPAIMTAIQATSTFKRVGMCTKMEAEKVLPPAAEMEGAITVTRDDVVEDIQFST